MVKHKFNYSDEPQSIVDDDTIHNKKEENKLMKNKTILIKSCIRSCPFYFSSMDGMECGHPYFNDKNSYERLIINQGDKIPKKCPLRKYGTLVLTTTYE